jgi:hypothetical protein
MRLLLAVAVSMACLLGSAGSAGAARDVIGFFDPSQVHYTYNQVLVNGGGTGGAAPGDVYVGSQLRTQLNSAGDMVRVFGPNRVLNGPDDSNETAAVMVRASGGTFTLAFGKKTTPPIAYNAPAEDPGTPDQVDSVDEALETLTSITADGGSVSVSGGPGSPSGASPYVVEFGGFLGGTDLPLIGADGSGLTGAPADVSAYTIVAGRIGYEVCEPALGDVCQGFAGGEFENGQRTYQGSLDGGTDLDQTTGEIYAANDGRVSVFSATGHFLRAFGPDVVAEGPNDSSIDEVQKLSVTATGGTFTLNFHGGLIGEHVTAPIPYNASPSVIESALNGLPSIAGAGNDGIVTPGAGGSVTVTGGPSGPADPGPWDYLITFGGYFGGDDIRPVGVSDGALEGAGHDATIATTVVGGATRELCTPLDACKSSRENSFGAPAPAGEFRNVRDIAVAPAGAPDAGNVLLADGSARVQELSPTGQFVRTFGIDVDATDPSTGFEVCTAASGHVCKAGVADGSAGDASARELDVDASGAVYTVENRRVRKFSPQAGTPELSPAVIGSTEVQQLKVNATGGQFRLGGIDDNGTSGSATATKDSNVLTNVVTEVGSFRVGERIRFFYHNNVLMPPGTTITAIDPGLETITLSNPVEITNASTSQKESIVSSRLYTTGDLAYNIPASGGVGPTASLQNALESFNYPPIADIDSIAVTGGVGGPNGGTPYNITFSGPTNPDPPELLSVQGSVPLTGGTGPGANQGGITTTTPGGPGGSSNADEPLDVKVGPGGGVFVLKEYHGGDGFCPDGFPAPEQPRVQELTPAGAVVETSVPCTVLGQVNPGSGQGGPHLEVGSATGFLYAMAPDCCNPGQITTVVLGPPSPAPDLVVTPEVSNRSPEGGTLSGTIDPNGPGPGLPRSSTTTYSVEFKRSLDVGWTKYVSDVPVGVGNSPVLFTVGVTGLEAKTDYDLRVVVEKLGDTVEDTTSFTTLAAEPSIGGLYSDHLTADSADVHAQINPRGAETVYHFEYGTTTDYGQSIPIPEESVGDGSAPVAVTAHLENLEDATYHFRVLATNELGTVASEDQSFSFHPPSCPNQTVRQQTSSSYLPDCRAYELVSPEDAGGTMFYTGGPQSPYASNPPRLAFTGLFGDVPGAGVSPVDTSGDLYIATRGAGGWTTRYIGPSSAEAACVGGRPIASYKGLASTMQNDVFADPGLGRILQWNLGNPNQCVAIGGSTDLNTAARGSNAPYVWDADGSLLDRWPTSVADVPGSVENFDCPQDPSLYPYPPGYGELNIPVSHFCSTMVTASKDLSHFIFSTQSGLFGEGGITVAPGSAYDNDVAENSLTLVSRLSNGDPIAQETPPNGGPEELIQFPAVSADGSHILMGTAVKTQCKQIDTVTGQGADCPIISQPTRLYMRVDNAVTYEVSADQSGVGRPVRYVASTSDGTRVYFTTDRQMTVDDTDQSVDLFLWDEHSVPHLTRVSAGTGGTGNVDTCVSTWTTDCDVQVYDDSTISSAAGNRGGLGTGSWKPPRPGYTDNSVAVSAGSIYFYSPEQLDNGRGAPGKPNLYVFHDGELRHVATLEDDPYCLPRQTGEGPDIACSDGALGRLQVTPNGRYAAFITTSRLTSFDNQGVAEMYRYNADTRNLVCVSCDPAGSAPQSDVIGSKGGRFITDDGRVFFDTEDPLTSLDSNGATDVYEFVEGRPQLITTGTGTSAGGKGFNSLSAVAGLYGVSADGVDVYFSSFETLVGQDRNGRQLKFYDARTSGGFPYVPPPLPCQAADECHGPSSAEPSSIVMGSGAALGAGGNHSGVNKKAKKKSHRRKKKSHKRSSKKQQERKRGSR